MTRPGLTPPNDKDHKLGALLDYFLMLNNTGVTLDDVLCHAVAENIDALQVHLVKCKKVLKEATKTQGKLLTMVAKLMEAQEKSLPNEVVHEEATETLCQATEKLAQVRDNITHHTAEILCIEERESTEEESSSPEDGLTPGSGSRDPPAPTQQEQDDIEMEDVENTSNPPQGMVPQTNPTPEGAEDVTGAIGGVDSTYSCG